jgi:hypothetical protein
MQIQVGLDCRTVQKLDSRDFTIVVIQRSAESFSPLHGAGRAWNDARLLGMAYAFEHLADAAKHGHVAPTTVPALITRKSTRLSSCRTGR